MTLSLDFDQTMKLRGLAEMNCISWKVMHQPITSFLSTSTLSPHSPATLLLCFSTEDYCALLSQLLAWSLLCSLALLICLKVVVQKFTLCISEKKVNKVFALTDKCCDSKLLFLRGKKVFEKLWLYWIDVRDEGLFGFHKKKTHKKHFYT